MTSKRGYDIHKLIDGLKDQQTTKALLRQLANLLCREIAIQRQENLSLRQRLAEKEEQLWELRNARSTIQSAPAPASTTQTARASRDKLVLKRTVDPHTVKQTFPKR
jgi:hypothetical protein